MDDSACISESNRFSYTCFLYYVLMYLLHAWTHSPNACMHLAIEVNIDTDQKTIVVSDNSGGVMEENLNLIVGPGQTSNQPTDEVIGIFGVGTKRAVVALSQDIEITSRHGRDKTYRACMQRIREACTKRIIF